MNLTSQLTALQEESRGLTHLERAQRSCHVAKQLEKAGEYEAACEALNEFWPERNSPPMLEGLDKATKAQVLLRVGALSGWLGSAHQTNGSQERAKNFITQSIELFDELDQPESVAEARSDLALCYWREGAFDEARINLNEALSLLKNREGDLKASILIRAGLVELRTGRLDETLRLDNEAAPLIETSKDSSLKGAFHNQLANLYKNLGTRERKDEHTDRALVEYAAASYYFEQAGHARHEACVENNLGFLFYTLGRFAEAHEHLDRAQNLFRRVHDKVHFAQVNDTRARTLIAENRLRDAERVARLAVKTLERGGEQALLAEALTTYGTALARTGKNVARATLDRAIEVAETCGDLGGAGRARLSIIEELSDQTPARELASIFESATDLLQHLQDPLAKERLISCARKVVEAFDAEVQRPRGVEDLAEMYSGEFEWAGFSLKKKLRAHERTIIERALKDAHGKVTQAARLLGFRHHQSLVSLINTRHRDLLRSRSAIRPRRHHLFSKPKKTGRKSTSASLQGGASQVSIPNVENNDQLES